MDADEFLAQEKPSPRKKRLFLQRYAEGIAKLHAGGCTPDQIVTWLKLQGVEVSTSTVVRYLRDAAASPAEPKHQTAKPNVKTQPSLEEGKLTSSEGQHGIGSRAAWEATANRYISNDNPLLKRKKDEK
ncbi:hypothetical protein [Parachitinimonas caeni]|uniref:Uncharacterized protein n=1 Tax=Parachitinimonas caeni TaxID=3031301 RepID=A0ABT7E2F8_9NEIS|nr:hypothetical protein [Parachitinimonas caeni]MDK2126502.1 hypothetical protein [Parachitinimonas caeni]